MKRYVLGVAFDYESNLVLIEKKRPDWQAEFYNFPGGKIEQSEEPIDAIVREFSEETGVTIDREDWIEVGHMSRKDDFECYIFLTIHQDVGSAATVTDEQVIKIDLDKFLIDSQVKRKCISNLHTVVEFLMSEDFTVHGAKFIIRYPVSENNLRPLS